MRKVISASVKARSLDPIARVKQQLKGVEYLCVYPCASPEIIWAMAEALDPRDPAIPVDQYKEIIKSQCYVDTKLRLNKASAISYFENCGVPPGIKYLKISGNYGGFIQLVDALDIKIAIPVCPSILQLFSWAKGWFAEDWVEDVEDFIANLILLKNTGYPVLEVPIDIGMPNEIDAQEVIREFSRSPSLDDQWATYGMPVSGTEIWEYFKRHL